MRFSVIYLRKTGYTCYHHEPEQCDAYRSRVEWVYPSNLTNCRLDGINDSESIDLRQVNVAELMEQADSLEQAARAFVY